MAAWLSERATRQVLQSLISATARTLAPRKVIPASPWPDTFSLGEDGHESLRCDSLDRLQIATAINVMFHLHEVGLEASLLEAATFGRVVALVRHAWQMGVSQISVSTSGSTGMPKYCAHLWRNLALEVDYLAALFRDRSRIIFYTPPHHLYGLLFAAMLPDRLSIPAFDLRVLNDTSLLSFGLQEGDVVVSFPDGWRWIDANLRRVPSNVEGITSTAPCPRTLIRSLTATRFSFLTEVYGASETAGIGIRRSPELAYTLMPHWRRVSGNKATALRHCDGFEVEPMDVLDFMDETHFAVARRVDSAVQVGGKNIFPKLIAERLRTFPGVVDASVRLMRPSEGQRLKCYVVPETSANIVDLEAALSSWVETWDVVAERSKLICFGGQLPRGDLGKAADW